MKSIWSTLLLVLTLFSCDPVRESDDDDNTPQTANDSTYIEFGTFYGFCMGESCIEIFKKSDTQLWEDTSDQYGYSNGYKGNYVLQPDSQFNKLSDWMITIPDTLLDLSGTVFGCPDCSDGGGAYLAQTINGERKFWVFDQFKSNLPKSLHEVLDQINQGVSKINS